MDDTIYAEPVADAVEAPVAEVLEKPQRRRFSAKYKLRILEELDRAPE